MRFRKQLIAVITLLVTLFHMTANAQKTDWSVAMVESTMKRYPTAKDLGSWGYAKSLYLYGQYLVLQANSRSSLSQIHQRLDRLSRR